jgi:uncharacterized cupin superfamily protein
VFQKDEQMDDKVTSESQLEERQMRIARTGELLALSKDFGAAFELSSLSIYRETIPSGRRSSSPHYHTKREEFVYVLSGTPSLWLDGQVTMLSPGDGIGFKPGGPKGHVLLNESTEVAEILSVSDNPEGDEVVYV